MTLKVKLSKLLLLFLIFVFMVGPAHSQPKEEQELEVSRPRRQITTIVFAGLAGAVMGLSTLSFYGRPQDKLSNIAIGFAIGVISGAVYTTFKAATNPYDDVYAYQEDLGEEEWASTRRSFENASLIKQTPQLNWTWSF